MKIYTKTGDKGETGLFGGDRVSKDDLRVAVYGDVDELNAVLGIVRLHPAQEPLGADLSFLQSELFSLGADLATPHSKKVKTARIGEKHASRLEGMIDRYQDKLPPQTKFVLPGGSPAAAHLHLARTVCRRAERALVHLMRSTDSSQYRHCLIYLNRLSDLLFSMARYANISEKGGAEVFWHPPSE